MARSFPPSRRPRPRARRVARESYRALLPLGGFERAEQYADEQTLMRRLGSSAPRAQAAVAGSAADYLIKKLRKQLAKRGARGMVGLSRNFRVMDSSGDGQLDEEEFGILLDR